MKWSWRFIYQSFYQPIDNYKYIHQYIHLSELEDFAIIATHTDPDEAAKEIGALHKVYESAKRHWQLEVIVFS